MADVLEFLKTRSSNPVVTLDAPGPEPEVLQTLLTIAARVPDHGKLAPWRFIVYRGAAREAIGPRLAARLIERNPEATEARREEEQRRFLRAPVVVAVVSRAAEHPKIPLWEQELSAGVAAYNLTLGAKAAGFGAQWRTEWVAYDEGAKTILGIAPQEKVAGFVYIGTAATPAPERPRPELAALVTEWTG